MEENKIVEEKMTPETCVKAGKCLMKEMMEKMKPSEDEYKNMSDEDKDKTDEKEVMEKE